MYILHDAGDANDMIDASSGWMNHYYDGTMSHTNIRYIKVKKLHQCWYSGVQGCTRRYVAYRLCSCMADPSKEQITESVLRMHELWVSREYGWATCPLPDWPLRSFNKPMPEWFVCFDIWWQLNPLACLILVWTIKAWIALLWCLNDHASEILVCPKMIYRRNSNPYT